MLAAWLRPLVEQQSWSKLAPFASQVLVLDETTLDPLARKLPLLRVLKKGAVELLPGKLAGLFDVRLQVWRRIEYLPDALQNSKVHARAMLAGLGTGALLLFDPGSFRFEWRHQVSSPRPLVVWSFPGEDHFTPRQAFVLLDGVFCAV